jgi:hypothetical protein
MTVREEETVQQWVGVSSNDVIIMHNDEQIVKWVGKLNWAVGLEWGWGSHTLTTTKPSPSFSCLWSKQARNCGYTTARARYYARWCILPVAIRNVRRYQWPRGLRRWSTAVRLLRSWVRIPPGAWMFVCCVCCVLSGRGLCDELITRPEGPTDCGASLSVIKKPRERGGHSPRWAAEPEKIIIRICKVV